MLLIRSQQLASIDSEMKTDAAVAHLYDCFAERCHGLGLESVRDIAIRALRSARNYELEAWADQLHFAALSLVFGPDFETRREFTWAADILNDLSGDRRYTRGLRLAEHARYYLESANEPPDPFGSQGVESDE